VQVPDPALATTEEFAPGVNGSVETLVIDGEEVTYEVVDGIAVAQGDIVLGDAVTLREMFGPSADAPRTVTCNFGFATDFACARWTDGVIGYSFANDWGDDDEDERMRNIIIDAMEEWETHTGIRFEERTTGEFLQFRDGDGCSSTIGRAVITGFDSQSITLNNTGCDDIGRAMHEIGHAIGLYHEQSRDDRDDWVVVDLGRVQDFKLHNFWKYGAFANDVGGYDYDSIMHYERWAFARNRDACEDGVLSECTVRPLDEDAAIGQRDHLSERDILGAYTLYPPEYEIVGASPGDTGDRFVLALDYSTEAPDPARIVWHTNLDPEPIGTGHSVDLRASDVEPGINLITASFVVADQVVTSRSILLNFENGEPTVTLTTPGGELEFAAGQVVTVAASVTDAEDGSCSPDVCTYNWLPTPSFSPFDGPIASYVFDDPGLHDIGVAVVDDGGAVGTAVITIEVVDTPPTVTLFMPTTPVSVPEGSSVLVDAIGHDPNAAGAGELPCSALTWTSSDPADTFSAAVPVFGCTRRLVPAGPGPRVVSVVATDEAGSQSDPATVDVTVDACGDVCPPAAYLSLGPPHDGSAYFLEFQTEVYIFLGDDDYEVLEATLVARRAGEADIPLYDRSVLAEPGEPDLFGIGLTLLSYLGSWSNCVEVDGFREYDLVLTATGADGLVTTDVHTITVGCTLI
jgi:hypothetical protein